MFGIDEDLNGRLFERSSMHHARQGVGPVFPPRSIVKLITRLADLQVSRTHVDRTLDACCGTGGFLIEILTECAIMVRGNNQPERCREDALIEMICNESIYGIDSARALLSHR